MQNEKIKKCNICKNDKKLTNFLVRGKSGTKKGIFHSKYFPAKTPKIARKNHAKKTARNTNFAKKKSKNTQKKTLLRPPPAHGPDKKYAKNFGKNSNLKNKFWKNSFFNHFLPLFLTCPVDLLGLFIEEIAQILVILPQEHHQWPVGANVYDFCCFRAF